MGYEKAGEVLRRRFKTLDEVPGDRLDCVNRIFQLKTAIILSLMPLDALITKEWLAAEYAEEELELIYECLRASAEPVKELYEYFVERAGAGAENAYLAV